MLLGQLFAEHTGNLVSIGIALAFLVIYWLRSNSRTALITLPFAFVSELYWNLAWLAYIPVAAVLKRRKAKSLVGR